MVWSGITVLRAASTVLVFLRTDTLLCWPVFAMALHLSLGDTWNTINNVEVESRHRTASHIISQH